MIKFKCRICGRDQERQPLDIIDKHWNVIRCKTCSFESIHPLPSNDELVAWYSDYPMTTRKDDDEWFERLQAMHQKIIDFLVAKAQQKKETLRFLDYGFGKGAFLIQVAKNGLSASGIEFSDLNCTQLQTYCKKNNLNIEIAKILDGNIQPPSNKPFDCITLFSVIEHTLDPVALLSNMSNLQAQGGILYLECPNNDALYLKAKNALRKPLGRENFFNSLNPPQHLNGFNRRSLNTLLLRSGYQPLELNDYRAKDRLHQVENVSWHPTLSDLIKSKYCRNTYAILQWLHKVLDQPAHVFFGAGTGLYALAVKK